ncbi:Deleted in azoospermia-like [Microtus ochrogaster]|uniref:Deleted in azoospermia-like n=1 Tax=Microtus ochrogaster TaxID=79684 RepID=A0A8J6L074_MICOH|nr:Deleted in azoospermia-like [Microtus ochrogaster]
MSGQVVTGQQGMHDAFMVPNAVGAGTYHVQPRPLIFNPPPPPQFQSVWSSPNAETYMQPPTMMNPITQYVQKSVDRSIQTVVSCLFNPENRLRNSLVTQDDYFKVGQE